ncbi:MAG: YcxB family protein [Myxococcota bacterium]
MTIEGQIAERDFVRAAFVHIRPSPFFAVIGALLGLLGLVLACLALFESDLQRVSLGVFILACLLYLGFYFAVWYPYAARRTFRQYKALSLPFTAEVTSDGFRVETELGQGLLPWDHIRRWRESKALFLLYPTDGLYHVVPKSLLLGGLDDEFRGLLKQKIGSPT